MAVSPAVCSRIRRRAARESVRWARSATRVGARAEPASSVDAGMGVPPITRQGFEEPGEVIRIGGRGHRDCCRFTLDLSVLCSRRRSAVVSSSCRGRPSSTATSPHRNRTAEGRRTPCRPLCVTAIRRAANGNRSVSECPAPVPAACDRLHGVVEQVRRAELLLAGPRGAVCLSMLVCGHRSTSPSVVATTSSSRTKSATTKQQSWTSSERSRQYQLMAPDHQQDRHSRCRGDCRLCGVLARTRR